MNSILNIKQEIHRDGSIRKTAHSSIHVEELYSRTPFSNQALDILKQIKVFIFGAGSGGSRLGIYLAQAGVGNIALADPNSLKVHNITRHEAEFKGHW